MEIIGLIRFLFFKMKFSISFNSLLQSFFAGSIAGITNTIAATPVERVKCLLQVILFKFIIVINERFLKAQETAKLNKNVSTTEYNGSFDCAKKLYEKGGIQNLYRGFGITIVRGRLIIFTIIN